MRIIAGAWRGRALIAPPGLATRPTADRVRQSLFDMLLHASWGGRAMLEGASVLDAFAGTGALGLEALSRGAAQVFFFERDRAALTALRANIAACDAAGRSRVFGRDVVRPGRNPGAAVTMAFFDPPYGEGLIARSVNVLASEGWLSLETLLIAEAGRLETVAESDKILAHSVHGAAQVIVWRM